MGQCVFAVGDDSHDELCCLGSTVHVSKRLKAGRPAHNGNQWPVLELQLDGGRQIGTGLAICLALKPSGRLWEGDLLSDVQFVVLQRFALCTISLSVLVLDKDDVLGSDVLMPLKTVYTFLEHIISKVNLVPKQIFVAFLGIKVILCVLEDMNFSNHWGITVSDMWIIHVSYIWCSFKWLRCEFIFMWCGIRCGN